MPEQRAHPDWLRQRAVGRTDHRGAAIAGVHATQASMRRLQLEATLDGHRGCVNCLEWNQSGDLLASGSDDHNVILWDPFRRSKRAVIATRHEGNIFSAKFMPQSGDGLVATCASDCGVKLINVLGNETLINCKSCHSDRVKRLATHPRQPNLIWSAGEDGYVMEYDIRQQHVCEPSKPNNLLIDLKLSTSPGQLPTNAAKCIATNPLRDEMLAVGSDDVYVRLYDRRFIRLADPCTAYFTPGHLSRPDPKTFGVTYLAFSPDGSELLANMHAEQIYLFNTYEPWQRYKSFNTSVIPLVLDLPVAQAAPTGPPRPILRAHNQWADLRRKSTVTQTPQPAAAAASCTTSCSHIIEQLSNQLTSRQQLSLAEFNQLNELISRRPPSKQLADLYNVRAWALTRRNWRGDSYQAVRDCCCALALRTLDRDALNNLALACCSMGDKTSAREIQTTLLSLDVGHDGAAHTESSLPGSKQLASEASRAINNLLCCDGGHFGNNDYSDADGTRGEQACQVNASLLGLLRNGELTRDIFDRKLASALGRSQRKATLEAFDYTNRFCGHCNMNTDIKEANFFGQQGEFIVAGSDDGAFYIWDKETGNIVKAVHADMQVLNCLQPHPSICMLATSGIEASVKLWSPSGSGCQDVRSLESRCAQNQKFISSDPLELMISMLWPTGR